MPGAAVAGVLCGTVRDDLTSQPVARAGIFLRTPAGAYTGIYGATDPEGKFCIGSVPAGTYDVEVRVDDYQVGYLRGVEVTDKTTGVEIPASAQRFALLAPRPSPARESVRLAFRAAVAGPVEVSILDVRGRVLRGWRAESAAGERSFDWDLRDREGRRIPAGLYFVQLRAEGRSLVRSFVRVL